jgi:hypothetical protein
VRWGGVGWSALRRPDERRGINLRAKLERPQPPRMRSINARSRASISSAGNPFERAAKYECAPKEDVALNPQRHTPPVISCGKMTPRGRACLVSLRTDAVGHTSSARHAASLSSCVFGCRAKTL